MNICKYMSITILLSIDCIKSSGTEVSGLWTDDHQHASNSNDKDNGWFKQNRHANSSINVYRALPQIDTIGTDGTFYYGPFEENYLGIYSGKINYFQRNFKCTQPTTSIIVQYFTATCAGYDVERDRTELWLNNKDIKDYHKLLGYDANGYNPNTNTNENGYKLNDNALQQQCRSLTNDDQFYWVQKHGQKWTQNENNHENILQNNDFRITIRIDADNDDLVLLYDITVECLNEIQSNNRKKHSDEKVLMIVGISIGSVVGIIVFIIIGYKCIAMKQNGALQNKDAVELELSDDDANQDVTKETNGNDSAYDMNVINAEAVEVEQI